MKVAFSTEACFAPATATVTVTALRLQTNLLSDKKAVLEVKAVVVRIKSKRICDVIVDNTDLFLAIGEEGALKQIYNKKRLAKMRPD